MKQAVSCTLHARRQPTMHVNAMIPAILFATLMVTCFVACYAIAVTRNDVQAWIPYISDLGLRGPEHFVFAQLLNVAAYVGMVMMLMRFLMVARRTDDTWTRILNWFSLFVGSSATLFLSFVANFPEQQSHGVGHVHVVGAIIVFTAGCVFIHFDTVVSLRMRLAESRQLRSVRWFEWIRPIVAVLAVCTWVLCILYYYSWKQLVTVARVSL